MGVKNELKENNYVVIRNFLEKEKAVKLASEFVFHLNEYKKEDKDDCDARFAYNYIPALEILCEKTPFISELIEETVLPTYAYAREYIKGHELTVHKDRPSCEVSLTVNLDCDKLWDFWVLTPSREKKSILLNPGDAVLYNGLMAHHWRDPYDGEYCIQMFLHYVKSQGQHYNNYFDRLLGYV